MTEQARRAGAASQALSVLLAPALLGFTLLAFAPGAAAQTAPPAGAAPAGEAAPRVALSGRFGDRALIVVNGRAHTVAVGDTVEGVRLLGWRDDAAQLQVGTQRLSLRVGGAPVDLTRAAPDAGLADGPSRVVLQADAGGHFTGSGSINGRSTRFMVDTGATLVALSQAEADRLGIAFRDAARGTANTANGEVPVHRVVLQTVRLGGVEVPRVEAVILPAALPHVLLGNNFLERFTMQREDGRMTLQRRP